MVPVNAVRQGRKGDRSCGHHHSDRQPGTMAQRRAASATAPKVRRPPVSAPPEPGGAAEQIGHDAAGVQATGLKLVDLSFDVLANIFLKLAVEDVAHLATCSRALRDVVENEALWYLMCDARWGQHTDVRQWLVGSRERPCSSVHQLPRRTCTPMERGLPQNYRSLYRLLTGYSQLPGLWTETTEAGDRLVHFRWAPDAIEGAELLWAAPAERPCRVASARLCPHDGVPIVAEVLDQKHCILRHFNTSDGWSVGAEAAAAVAVSSMTLRDAGAGAAGDAGSGSVSLLGSSPQGSFEYELASFMNAQVAPGSASRKSSRKRLSKSPSSPGVWPMRMLHHLRRVEVPLANQRHQLAGLWAVAPPRAPGGMGVAAVAAADFSGPHSDVQVLSLQYDFSGPSATIVATLLTGQYGVGARGAASGWGGLLGASQPCVMWRAAAAPLRMPLPEEELQLIDDRPRLFNDTARGLEVALGFAFDSDSEAESDAAGSAAAAGGHGSRERGDGKSVAACFKGQGALPNGPGLSPAAWSDGRLWLYSDGSAGFLWREEEILVEMVRIDVSSLERS